MHKPYTSLRRSLWRRTDQLAICSASVTFNHLIFSHTYPSPCGAIICVLIGDFLHVSKSTTHYGLDHLGIPVLCYGTQISREPFEGSQYLLAWADIISEIKTICHSGRKAIMNARLDANGKRVWDGSQVEIGHNYVSVSRREFNLLRASGIDYAPPVATLENQQQNES